MSEKQSTELIEPLDRSQLVCVRAAWKCLLDQVQPDTPIHQLIVDTIYLLEDRADGRI